MKEEYKEWVITYNERSFENKFQATKKDGDKTLTSDNLSDMKKKINTYKKGNFRRIPCFIKAWNSYDPGNITSIAKQTSNNRVDEFWVSIQKENGSHDYREKKWFDSAKIYHRNDKNTAIITKIEELEKQIKELTDQISEQEELLGKITNIDIQNGEQK